MFANTFIVKIQAAFFAVATFFLTAAPSLQACTGVRLMAGDGSIVHARTLEFAVDLQSAVVFVPRGYERVGTTPDGKPGLKWKAKYASLGASGLGQPIIVDGLNEKGLAAGLFYFPGYAGYVNYAPQNAERAVAPWEFVSWVLDNHATLDEVRANLPHIDVVPTVWKDWGIVIPMHCIVHDAQGNSIVVEYVGGKLNVYDNPLGVITNAPTFDWHMTNLSNYVNLSLDDSPAERLGSVAVNGLGAGSGMLGLPGDFTPPSRFVRAALFSQSAMPAATGRDAVLQAFHILNNFDIPKGSIRQPQRNEQGKFLADYTQWTSASDLQAKRFYFRTFDNSRVRMVDMTKMDLNAPDVVTISMAGEEDIQNLTP